ncbi:hypothetical protein [Falsarthrobacter nasiphocae]|uniref:hypothetical protein n=1 Tax=Falsarthrobacter nasiphocae TaxID=189863 RepID=UPI0031D48CDC
MIERMREWGSRHKALLWGIDFALFGLGLFLMFGPPKNDSLGYTVMLIGSVFGFAAWQLSIGKVDLDLSPEEKDRIDPDAMARYLEEHPHASWTETIKETTRAPDAKR